MTLFKKIQTRGIKLPFRLVLQRLHVFSDKYSYVWVVAFDKHDAFDAYLEWTGQPSWEIESDDFPIHLVRDNFPFPISGDRYDMEEYIKNPPMFSIISIDEDSDFVTITAPAWAWAVRNGRGFLGASEY